MTSTRSARIRNHSDLLPCLGRMALELSPDNLLDSLDRASELLHRATEADACEIFLSEPDGGDLLLAASVGPGCELLHERTRFGLGVGFPGIAAATGRPVVTRRLNRDQRFLRRQAVRAGISTFAAVPLSCDQGTVGCVCLAWKAPSETVEAGLALLQNATPLLATMIRSGLLATRERMEAAVAVASPDPEARARACLQVMVEASGARGGTLAMYNGEHRESLVYSTASGVEICTSALDGRLRCGMVAEGHGVTLVGTRGQWPAPCRCLPETTKTPTCLPLRLNGRLHGVAVLDRGDVLPCPPSRDLVPLLAMAREAARWLPGPAGQGPQPVAGPAGGAVLEIRALGGFEVRLKGKPLPTQAFGRRKALTLLKLLVLKQGTPVSRHALAEHLWPGVDEQAGANRLHGVLHALRSAIEPSRKHRRWIYVCSIGELYYFNLESPHWADLYAFRRLAASGHEAVRQHRTQEAVRDLETALELYRGDLFADEPYAEWCELARSELRYQAIDLMVQVSELWGFAGEIDRSVAWLRRGLQLDPLREDLHQALIQRLLDRGRPLEAHAQYNTCAGLLRRELGVDPLPETRRLRTLLERDLARHRDQASPVSGT